MNGGIAQYLQDPSTTNDAVIADMLHVAEMLAWWVIGLAPIAALGCFGVSALRRHNAKAILSCARLLHLAMPPTVDPAGATIFWTNLHDLLRPTWKRFWHGQPHLSFEYIWNGPELRLQLWVPRAIPTDMVRRAALSAWPGTAVDEVENSELLRGDSTAVVGRLRLNLKEWYSIRTDYDADPLRAVIGAVGSLDVYQSAVVQVVARPATGRRTARCMRTARQLRSGKPTSFGLEILDFVQPGVSTGKPNDDPMRNRDVRDVTEKASSICWEAEVRYGVSDLVRDRARAQLHHRAHGLASSFSVYTGRNRLRRCGVKPTHVLTRRLGRGNLLSVAELAALAHLPTDQGVAGLDRAGAKSVEPLPVVSRAGMVLGDSNGERRTVAIDDRDSCYHLHVLGSTGSGKSNLLTNLILGDIESGKGGVVIDPKGDLVNDVLERLPAGLAERIVLLDPTHGSSSPSLDVLGSGDTHLAVENIVGIFSRIYEAHWGPRTDDVLRTACLTLRDRHGKKATLTDVPRLLGDRGFRRRTVTALGDGPLKAFWQSYDEMSVSQQSQLVAPLMNKLRAFMLRGFLRDTVGRSRDIFDVDQVFADTFFLVRIPKGIIGDETSRLIGSLVVARIWQAGLSRAGNAIDSRRPTRFYVDECQNFLNLPRSFEEMLAEARGYGLSLVLAHQHLGQLSRELREAISANARNKVFFTMSPEDAHFLARPFEPELNAHDLSHLGAYQVAARLVAEGRDQPAFTLSTRKSSDPRAHNALSSFDRVQRNETEERLHKAEQAIEDSLTEQQGNVQQSNVEG